MIALSAIIIAGLSFLLGFLIGLRWRKQIPRENSNVRDDFRRQIKINNNAQPLESEEATKISDLIGERMSGGNPSAVWLKNRRAYVARISNEHI